MSSSPRHRTALITGATAGIGYWTAMGLAARGDTVFVTGRNEQRGAGAVADIRARAGHDRVRFLPADHCSVGGNVALAARIADEVDGLDVLVNNVGGIYPTRSMTADGYETTLATNLVGPFALTRDLLPLLRGRPARCVNVVSSAYTMVKGDPFTDVHAGRNYVGIDVYARAKLLALAWTVELARREKGTGVAAFAVNPGMAWTPSIQRLTPQAVPAWRWVWPLVRWFQRRASAERASRAPITAATAWELAWSSGSYLGERGRIESLTHKATDPELPARAWQLAQTLATAAPTARTRTYAVPTPSYRQDAGHLAPDGANRPR